MDKKAQAATEFLATYGWALLIMFVILAVLIGTGVFNPTRYANEECTFQPNLPCTQYYLVPVSSGAALSFNITNTMGFPIAIMGYAAEVEGSTTNCIDKKCAPSKYLAQGDSYMITLEPLNLPYEFTTTDFAKIKVNLQFRNCQGKTEADCINSVSNPSYYTWGRINLFPRGDIKANGDTDPLDFDCRNPQAFSGDEFCRPEISPTAYISCTPNDWTTLDCPDGTKCEITSTAEISCVQIDSSSCQSGEFKCGGSSGNIQIPCFGGSWGDPLINGQPCPQSSPICEEYTQNGLRQTRCVQGQEQRCPPTQDVQFGGVNGGKYCTPSSSDRSYDICENGGWSSNLCPDNQACDQTTATSISCVAKPDCSDLLIGDGFDGDERCDAQDPTTVHTCASDGKWYSSSCAPPNTCVQTSDTTTDCRPTQQLKCTEPDGNIGETTCKQNNYFVQSTCVKPGDLPPIWNDQLCGDGEKCLNGRCTQDPPQPDCMPGTMACGEQGPNQNKILRCTQDQLGNWKYIYDGTTPDCAAQGLVCNGKGAAPGTIAECVVPDDFEVFSPCVQDVIFSACTPNGGQTGTTVFECRGGILVRTQYCEGNTYCLGGQCVSR